jgi:hypothetical protein
MSHLSFAIFTMKKSDKVPERLPYRCAKNYVSKNGIPGNNTAANAEAVML